MTRISMVTVRRVAVVLVALAVSIGLGSPSAMGAPDCDRLPKHSEAYQKFCTGNPGDPGEQVEPGVQGPPDESGDQQPDPIHDDEVPGGGPASDAPSNGEESGGEQPADGEESTDEESGGEQPADGGESTEPEVKVGDAVTVEAPADDSDGEQPQAEEPFVVEEPAAAEPAAEEQPAAGESKSEQTSGGSRPPRSTTPQPQAVTPQADDTAESEEPALEQPPAGEATASRRPLPEPAPAVDEEPEMVEVVDLATGPVAPSSGDLLAPMGLLGTAGVVLWLLAARRRRHAED